MPFNLDYAVVKKSKRISNASFDSDVQKQIRKNGGCKAMFKKAKTVPILFALIVMVGVFTVVPAKALGENGVISIAIGQTFSNKEGADLGTVFIDKNSRTLVPLGAIANLLDLSVSWDASTQTASFSDGKRVVAFKQNSNIYAINSMKMKMDTVVINKDGRVYAPVCYLAEAFDFIVGWNAKAHTVVITKDNSTKITYSIKSGTITSDDIISKTFRTSNESQNFDAIILTNNTDTAYSAEITAMFYDQDGNMVDVTSGAISDFAAHFTGAYVAYPTHKYSSVEYKVELKKLSDYYSYRSVANSISVTSNITSNSVVGTVTNNADYASNVVYVHALCFNNGRFVSTAWDMAMNSNWKVDSGESIAYKCNVGNTVFDSALVFVDTYAED